MKIQNLQKILLDKLKQGVILLASQGVKFYDLEGAKRNRFYQARTIIFYKNLAYVKFFV